jgi:beta-lactam-binding protein with PASTA domain
VSETTDQRSQDGRVLDQTPGAGRRVPRGYTVTIFVGRFQETSTTTTTTTSTP